MKKMKVLVACGGGSPEREVSLRSGKAVAEALAVAGHQVFLEDLPTCLGVVEAARDRGADLVFVALHGGWGEDGRLQAVLEAHGIPYTGSGPESCMAAMDKELTRAVFLDRGLPVPPGKVYEREDAALPDLESLMAREGGHLALKPCCCGSTVGVSLVHRPEDLREARDLALKYDDRLVAERFIPGRELTVAVFEEGGRPRALPAIEIRPHEGFYDYRNKYTSGATEYLCPAPLEEALAARVGSLAEAAHRALGCRVYSRVDFRLSEEGEPFLLEVNTAPGMTGTSLVPKAGAAVGWSFPQVTDRIVRASLEVCRGRR